MNAVPSKSAPEVQAAAAELVVEDRDIRSACLVALAVRWVLLEDRMLVMVVAVVLEAPVAVGEPAERVAYQEIPEPMATTDQARVDLAEAAAVPLALQSRIPAT